MKSRYWFIIWGALLAFCVASGLVTRASFTSFSPNQDAVLSSYYTYDTAPTGISNIKYNTLAKNSQVIVTCRFTGTREIQNKCYLSDVEVTKVIKGEQTLKGKVIKVYEPVSTQMEITSRYKVLKNYNELVNKFDWQGKTKAVFSSPEGTDFCYNYAMMAKGQTYLLFLNLKQVLPEMKNNGVQNYVMVDNPFAKLTVSNVNAATYQTPADLISLKESMNYEILLKDPSSIKTYFAAKQNILSQLKLI